MSPYQEEGESELIKVRPLFSQFESNCQWKLFRKTLHWENITSLHNKPIILEAGVYCGAMYCTHMSSWVDLWPAKVFMGVIFLIFEEQCAVVCGTLQVPIPT